MTLSSPVPTLNDVADKSGFSTATVSRCLNFPDQVSEKTKAKVMAAISELGYSPNFAARAMAAKRTNTIGAIIPTMENAIFAKGLQAFQEELALYGYTLLVASSSYNAEQEERNVRALVARGADGLLLIGHKRLPSIYEFLEAQGVPSLVTWAFDEAAEKVSVGFDNTASMRAMATEVIGFGHKDLAFLTAPTTRNDRARSRLDGVRDAMQVAGLDPNGLVVVETPYSIENGSEGFQNLMRRPHPPTAVLCGNDVLGVGAILGAREMGLEVPSDVSITGFDDIDLGQVISPALATVHVPHRQMGRTAATRLIEMVEGQGDGASIRLDTSLRLRQSLSAPKT